MAGNRNVKGIIHSIQSLGGLDGPGLRTVIVLQGCTMKCKFCHSIDTTLNDRGEEVTVGDIVDRVLRNKPYWEKYTSYEEVATSLVDDSPNSIAKLKGGVTITGGDPAAQPEFTKSLLIEFKKLGIHTAVESPLHIAQTVIDMWLPYVDLWMVSLKHMDNAIHQELTGKPNTMIMKNIPYVDVKLEDIRLTSGRAPKIRIRYVVIPDMHDDEAHMVLMGRFVANIRNLEYFELLKYTSMGAYRWEELFGKYELEGTPDASDEDISRVKGYLDDYRLPLM